MAVVYSGQSEPRRDTNLVPLVPCRGHRQGKKADLKSEGVIHPENVSSAPLKGRAKSRHIAGTRECVLHSGAAYEVPVRHQQGNLGGGGGGFNGL